MLSLFTLVTALASENPTYDFVDDQKFKSCESSDFIIAYNNRPLKVDLIYCSIDNQISMDFIKEQIMLDSKLIFDFAKLQQVSGYECALNQKLEIYQISSEKINSMELNGLKKNPNSKYQGIYDPRVKDVGVSTILISDQSNLFLNKLLFSHELSHYWFDRLCWDNDWGNNSESFARKFEEYYKERVK